MKWAAAMPPAMEACWPSLPTPLPAKKAQPPWDSCRTMGHFWSRAASSEETTVDDEVTF
jgi:hypothetical protein